MEGLSALRFLHSLGRVISKLLPFRSLRWETNSVYGKLLPRNLPYRKFFNTYLTNPELMQYHVSTFQ